jgi:chromosome segregation ATPase
LVGNVDKKVIERLKYESAVLIKKLEKALSDYYEVEYRARHAEHLREEYYEIVEKAVKDRKEIFDYSKTLEDKICNLTEAFGNAKSEISRLNIEINNEKDKYLKIVQQYDIMKKEKENKEEEYKREIKDLIVQIQILSEKNEKGLISNFKQPKVEDGLKNKIKEMNKSHNNNNQNSNEVILKYQLEIVDLKKKVEDDEIQKAKLFEIIRNKKEKVKMFKNDLSKLIVLFEECEKEVKWSQDLVSQKKGLIKTLRDKVNEKENEKRKLFDDLERIKNKSTTDVSVEVNNEDIIPVIPSILFK